jgi:type IV pilus assembly protein PilE
MRGHYHNKQPGHTMKPDKMRGMTLIELMIVVAILGIIAAIGYPSYQDQVRKSRRAEGMGELMELADRMERHYADLGTYDQADGTNMTAAAIFRSTTSNGYYTLSVVGDTDNVSYTIEATPTTKGKQNKDECSKFTLDSLGIKTSTPADKCWK